METPRTVDEVIAVAGGSGEVAPNGRKRSRATSDESIRMDDPCKKARVVVDTGYSPVEDSENDDDDDDLPAFVSLNLEKHLEALEKGDETDSAFDHEATKIFRMTHKSFPEVCNQRLLLAEWMGGLALCLASYLNNIIFDHCLSTGSNLRDWDEDKCVVQFNFSESNNSDQSSTARLYYLPNRNRLVKVFINLNKIDTPMKLCQAVYKYCAFGASMVSMFFSNLSDEDTLAQSIRLFRKKGKRIVGESLDMPVLQEEIHLVRLI